mmetsp:Transcript_69318/g.196438  ORF Transcript_69318/g.196438 Transcript_69318/m.196438 type:complete len:488 (-) Transcript_69318:20-1483(-)
MCRPCCHHRRKPLPSRLQRSTPPRQWYCSGDAWTPPEAPPSSRPRCGALLDRPGQQLPASGCRSRPARGPACRSPRRPPSPVPRARRARRRAGGPMEGEAEPAPPLLALARSAARRLTPRCIYWTAHGLLGAILLTASLVILPTAMQMVGYAASIIYIGAHHSLAMFRKDPETGESREVEAVSRRDAMLFPVVGSAALAGLYGLSRLLGKRPVNSMLTGQLALVGVTALAESIRPLIAPLFPEEMRRRTIFWSVKVPHLGKVFKEFEKPWRLHFGKVHMVAYGIAVVVSVAYLLTGHWSFHNAFAASFCLQAVALISFGRFDVGLLLLGGLCCYDLFWLFTTDATVSVATRFSGPTKIIFPLCWDPWKQLILGLGDIIVPGAFVAMCLRFDARNVESDGAEALDAFSSFPKPNFWIAFGAYLAALLATGLLMSLSGRERPAMVCLVPAVMLALLGASHLRGQLEQLFAYSEEELAPKEGSKESGKDE